MSELTLTESEVLTDHTDVICSTSIERIIIGRSNVLKQIETLIQHVADISTLTSSIGGKTVLDWAMKMRCFLLSTFRREQRISHLSDQNWLIS